MLDNLIRTAFLTLRSVISLRATASARANVEILLRQRVSCGELGSGNMGSGDSKDDLRGMSDAIEKRFARIEAKLLVQEHRWTHIALNFWNRSQWPKDDPRRSAVVRAFFWRFITPASAAATGGAIIGGVTLVLLGQQTALLRDQNTLIQDQNKYFQDQIAEMKAQNRAQDALTESNQSQADLQRKTQLVTWIYETGPQGALANARTRAEALVEYTKMEEARLGNHRSNVINLTRASLENIRVVGEHFRNVNFMWADLRNAQFNDCTFIDCMMVDISSEKAPPTFYQCTFFSTLIDEGIISSKAIFLNCQSSANRTAPAKRTVTDHSPFALAVTVSHADLFDIRMGFVRMGRAMNSILEHEPPPGAEVRLKSWGLDITVTNWSPFLGDLRSWAGEKRQINGKSFTPAKGLNELQGGQNEAATEF